MNIEMSGVKFRFKIHQVFRSLPMLLLVSGVFLRMAGIGSSSIWYDEAYSLSMARLPLLVNIKLQMEAHTAPLWEIISWVMVQIMGENIWAVRIPALLASLIGLILAWKIVKVFIQDGQPGQVAAAVLLGLLPYQFWMAQDGRVYALETALYLGMLWSGLRRQLVGLVVCGALLVYAHMTGIFYLLGGLVAIWIFQQIPFPIQRRQFPIQRRQYLITVGWIGLALLPRIPEYVNLTSSVPNFWLPIFDFPHMASCLSLATFAGTLHGLWPILAVGLILICVVFSTILTISDYYQAPVKDPHMMAIGAAALLPMVMMVLVSINGSNVVIYRTLSPSLVVLCIWFAAVLTPRRLTITTWVIPYTWLILIVVGLVNWSPVNRGGQLQEAAERINRNWQAGDVIIHASTISWLPMSYYLDHPGVVIDRQANPGFLTDPMQDALNIPIADAEDLNANRIWVIWAKDPILNFAIQNRIEELTVGASWSERLDFLQISPIEIYLLEGKDE